MGIVVDDNPSTRRSKDYIIWGILTAGALVLRGVFTTSRAVLTGDEIHYAESLHLFMEGKILAGVSEYWSFLYPFIAVPFGVLAGHAETGLRILSVCAGSALVVPCILLAQMLWGKREALFAGILIALHPTLIVFSSSAMTESFYTLLVFLSLFFLVNFSRRGTALPLVWLGITLGLAHQVRPEAQFILIFSVIFLLLGRGSAALAAPPGIRLRRAVIVVVLFVVTVLPYTILLHHKTGHWTGGSKAAVNLSSPHIWEEGLDRERFVYSLNSEGTARRIDEIGRRNPMGILWERKAEVASSYFQKLSRGVQLLPMVLATPFLLLLVPLGIFGRGWKREDRGAESFLLLIGAFPFILYSLFRIEVRYLVPFLPLYLLWGAVGCGVLCDWLEKNVARNKLVCLFVLLVIFMSLVPFTVHRYRLTASSQPREYREIGYWIGENTRTGERVLAHSGCPVSYYAGRPEATFIPWTDPEGIVRYARHHGYAYLVADEGYFRKFRPTLVGILDGEYDSDFTKINTFRGPGGGRIILFHIKR